MIDRDEVRAWLARLAPGQAPHARTRGLRLLAACLSGERRAGLAGSIRARVQEALDAHPSPAQALAPLLDVAQLGCAGSHMTPPALATLMVRLALAAWLSGRTGLEADALGDLCLEDEASGLGAPDRRRVAAQLDGVTIIDPAAGTGVFLLCAMEVILRIRNALGVPAGDEGGPAALLARSLSGTEVDPPTASIARAALALAARALAGATGPSRGWPGASARSVRVANALARGPDPHRGRAFDIVVTNPPYVRQEGLGRAGRATAKARALAAFQRWTGLRPDGRSDLYVPFFALLGPLLAPGGVGALLTSLAWLDARYGQPLKRFLLSMGDLVVLEPLVERWFEGAAVNAGIAIVTRRERPRAQASVRFAALARPIARLSRADRGVLARAVTATAGPQPVDADVRVRPVPAAGLATQPKWGQYLRAPPVWHEIERRTAAHRRPITQIARIAYGVRTGQNDSLVLEDITRAVDPGAARDRLGETPGAVAAAGDRIVRPLAFKRAPDDPEGWHRLPARLLSPFLLHAYDCRSLWLDPGAVGHRLLVATPAEEDPLLGRYVAWAERRGLVARGRRPWWALAGRFTRAVIAYPDHHDERALVVINPARIPVSNNFFVLEPLDPSWTAPLVAYLVSSPGLVERELVGRAALGDGGLKTDGADLRLVRVPDPTRLRARGRASLERLVEIARRRDCGSVSRELPGDAWREALDRTVLEWMGAGPDLQGPVAAALAELLLRRRTRAHTVTPL